MIHNPLYNLGEDLQDIAKAEVKLLQEIDTLKQENDILKQENKQLWEKMNDISHVALDTLGDQDDE